MKSDIYRATACDHCKPPLTLQLIEMAIMANSELKIRHRGSERKSDFET